MHLERRMHPDLRTMSCGDDFQRRNSSCFDGNLRQGCIWRGGCILIREKCLAGMISNREFHPDLMETSGRDDFQRRNASLKARIANLRCIRAGNIILEKAKSKFRIHRPGTQQKTQENRSKNKAKAKQKPATAAKTKQKQSKKQQPQQTAAMSCKHNMAAAYSFRLTFVAESNAILISPLQPAHHNQPCRC